MIDPHNPDELLSVEQIIASLPKPRRAKDIRAAARRCDKNIGNGRSMLIRRGDVIEVLKAIPCSVSPVAKAPGTGRSRGRVHSPERLLEKARALLIDAKQNKSSPQSRRDDATKRSTVEQVVPLSLPRP